MLEYFLFCCCSYGADVFCFRNTFKMKPTIMWHWCWLINETKAQGHFHTSDCMCPLVCSLLLVPISKRSAAKSVTESMAWSPPNQSENAVTSRESCVQQMAVNSQLWASETGSSCLGKPGPEHPLTEWGEEVRGPRELKIKELQLGNINEESSQKISTFVKSLQFVL